MDDNQIDPILSAARKDTRKAAVLQLLFIAVLVALYLINRTNGFLDSFINRFV